MSYRWGGVRTNVPQATSDVPSEKAMEPVPHWECAWRVEMGALRILTPAPPGFGPNFRSQPSYFTQSIWPGQWHYSPGPLATHFRQKSTAPMASRYLLPCDCGNSIAVDTAQAGTQVTCSCGASLDVPTMRGLRDLDPVREDHAKEEKSRGWGAGHGALLLGLILFIVGAGPALYLYATIPEPPEYDPALDRQIIGRYVDSLSPAQTWGEYRARRPIPTPSLNKFSKQRSEWEQKVQRTMRWVYVSSAVAALGLVVAVLSLFATSLLQAERSA